MQESQPIPEFPFSETELERYSRQLLVKGFGFAQQQHLAKMSVAVSSQLPMAALYLAAAGIGTLIVICAKETCTTEGAAHLIEHLLANNSDICVVDETVPGATPAPADLTICLANELPLKSALANLVLYTQPPSLEYYSAGQLLKQLTLPSLALVPVTLSGGTLAAAFCLSVLLEFPQ